MIPETDWHYVTRNEAARYPRRIICLDSEACREVITDGERHTFLLAAASYDHISHESGQPRISRWLETDDPHTLWQWISNCTKPRERTCLFAHNLGYDLRITQAFTILPVLGWKLKFVSLDTRRCYVRWSRAGATLSLSDSTSYFPCSLDRIATELGLSKTPLPGIGEAADKYYDRCRQDVVILRQAVLNLLAWLERNNCGNFKPTGPAQAWTTFRHRFLHRRTLLVHRDSEALAAEREAAWTGRTEAFRHGEYHYPLEEYDYRLAYATIAAESELPSRLLGSRILNRELKGTAYLPGVVTLYECSVTTTEPTAPTRISDRIAWPVGSFATTLFDCEAQLVLDNGGTVYAQRCWQYLKTPFLREWGEWIIATLSDASLDIPPLIRIMLKHWARCLIGRFGMRYPDWSFVGNSSEDGLVHFDCYDYDGGSNSEYLQIGKDWYSCEGRRDGFDTLPAVMAYVMALQRVKVWSAIKAAGESELFYLDTDSLLVTPTGGRNLQALRSTPGHGNLLRKAEYPSVTIYGPRALVLDGEPRIAGLPRRAQRTGRRNYKHEIWQSLGDSLKNGDPTSVRVTPRSFAIPASDTRRRHLANGHTEPFRVTLPLDSGNVLC